MADNVETPRVLDELTRANAAPVPAGGARPRRSVLGRLLATLLLYIPLLLGLGYLGYLQWQLNLGFNRLATDSSRLQETVRTSSARIAELEAEVNSASTSAAIDAAAIESLQNEFSSRLEQINVVLAELQNQLPRTLDQENGRWQFTEAQHLLRLASRHLPLSADVPTTIRLLQTADRLLVESSDNRIEPVRQALAADLDRLRSVEEFDPQRVYERINSLREQLAGLEMAPSLQDVYLQRLASQGPGGIETTSQQTRSLLDSGVNYLRSVFIWRQWPDGPENLQLPGELFYARSNISLVLQQAQLALLTQRRGIFLDSLQRSRDLAGRYQQVLGEPAVRILGELDSLIEGDAFPELPQNLESSDVLEQLVAGSIRR